jgi:hypothetical protein
MSYQHKLSCVISIIENYNKEIDDSEKSYRIDVPEFIRRLKNKIGVTESSVKAASWEDIEKCGIPAVLARECSNVFRDKVKIDVENQSIRNNIKVTNEKEIAEKKKVAKMAPVYLLQAYQPGVSDEISKRLKCLSQGRKFIALGERTIHVTRSLHNLQEIIKISENPEGEGVVPPTTYNEGGRIKKLYSIDELTNGLMESPLFPGSPLNDVEYDEKIGRSWKGVSLEARQVIYLAVTRSKEIDNKNFPNNHEIYEVAQNGGIHVLRSIFPKAYALFLKLKDVDDLPELKWSPVFNSQDAAERRKMIAKKKEEDIILSEKVAEKLKDAVVRVPNSEVDIDVVMLSETVAEKLNPGVDAKEKDVPSPTDLTLDVVNHAVKAALFKRITKQ